MSVMESHATKLASDNAHDAVINVESLSYKGSDGWLYQTNLTIEQTNALIYHLHTKYHAVEIGMALPFIEVMCLWRSEDDGMFSPIFGEFAWGDEIDIDENIVSMIKSRAPLPQQAIDFFAFELVPDCIGLAVIYNTLVIELPETDFETFHRRLATLSGWVGGVPFPFHYNNGPLPNSKHTIDSGAARNQRFMSMGWRYTKVAGARGSFVQQTAYADLQLRNADTAGEFIRYSDVFDPLIEIGSEVTL
ncbi:hypothetical protein CGCSCA4_v000539 [Colletotrichum siamense]|nr:hypothetical protein CGCSCA4_v000539 [Colletotrichum siamense]